MDDVTVRRAVMGDYDEISEVLSEMDRQHADALPKVFRKPDVPLRSRTTVANLLADPSGTILVAVDGVRIVAVAQVSVREAPDFPVFRPRRYAWVEAFAVREVYRRRGIGKTLMEAVVQWAVGRGAASLELNVWEFNSSAISFYERFGYDTSSRRMCISFDQSEGE